MFELRLIFYVFMQKVQSFYQKEVSNSKRQLDEPYGFSGDP